MYVVVIAGIFEDMDTLIGPFEEDDYAEAYAKKKREDYDRDEDTVYVAEIYTPDPKYVTLGDMKHENN